MMHIINDFKNDNMLSAEIEYIINAPMQCMMKGICGQCIVPKKDNDVIFSCRCQNQKSDTIDLYSLRNRLEQNKLFEKLNG